MPVWNFARAVIGATVLLLFVGFIVGSMLNATTITKVRMRLQPGAEEPSDHHLLGVGARDKLPDYMLRIRTRDGWELIGTRPNTSAVQWLSFPLPEGLPLRRAIELQLIEDDTIENDTLEQLPIIGRELSGKLFEFELITQQSFAAGIDWFFATAVGKAIALGIIVAVVIMILAILGPVLPW